MFPPDYKPPSTSNYIKFPVGVTRLRVLSESLIGESGWRDKEGGGRECVRCALGEILPPGLTDHKRFIAVVAYDYTDSRVKIWEITQKGIQDDLHALFLNKEWGDQRAYGLTMTREGSGRDDTKYRLQPSPKSPLAEEIKQAWKDAPPNLAALLTGEDPFAYGDGSGEAAAFAAADQAAAEQPPAPAGNEPDPFADGERGDDIAF